MHPFPSTRIPLVVLSATLMLSATAVGETYLVPGDHGTIQGAINACDFSGDEIIVGPGTYPEAINFLGKAIDLRSSNGPDVTIIDASGLGTSVVTCASSEGPGTVLDGFTITGGNAPVGGGMYNNNSSPTVTNCTFSGNWGDLGGGMNNEWGSPTVTNCAFSQNAGVFGGGVRNFSANPTVANCTFSANAADINGGGMYNNTSSPTVTNCTFSGNTGNPGGGMYNLNSIPTVTNCILWDNVPEEIFGPATVSYSDVQGGWADTGNIDADPLFVDPAGGDLRLMPGSPCIDAGNNAAVPVGVATDLDGNPRFVDDECVEDCPQAPGTCGDPPIVDMGAYEQQLTGLLLHVPGDLATIQQAIDAGCEGTEITVGPGTYNEVIDLQGKAIHLHSSAGPDVTIINGSGSSVVTCGSGEGPDTVIEGFTITGGGGSIGGGMYSVNSSPTVTNCTFSGNAVELWGGGMFNYGGSPTVANCAFSGNSAADAGGGMCNAESASPTVTNCTFSGNTATGAGGGMCNLYSASPTVTNCTFSENTATENGGGMYNYDNSSPTVTNCILWGNTGGGISNDGTSSPTVTFSDVPGGYAGEGNINADPLLADPASGDLRLLPGSPCIDAGNTIALPWADLDGNHRVVDDPATPDSGVAFLGATVDMGAYELAFHPADFNHDGLVNAVDLALLLGAWGPWP